MHTFVHVTKTGGTAVEQYFKAHHPRQVKGVGHLHRCGNSSNPIVIIRDPMERFVSMFEYWRNGATDGKYQRKAEWVSVNTISDFVRKLRGKDRSFERNFLHRDFTTNLHFCEQAYWLKPADYAKTTVLVYDRDRMDEKLRALLTHLGLPHRGLPLPRVNVTKTDSRVDTSMTDDDRAWVRERFRCDFELWHMVTRHPGRFKVVF